MALAFDPSAAYMFGLFVEAAYRLFKVTDPATTAIPLPAGWHEVTGLTAIDKVGLKSESESFGIVAQSDTEPHVLIAIRGTDTLLEWLVDAEFAHRPFPGAPNAGNVEDGFCGVYSTLRCSTTPSGVIDFVAQLAQGTRVTVAGHSLGAAVATLLALDVAVNAPHVDLTLYTYASPRVGDSTFAAFCSAHVGSHYRIVNRADIVPSLPPAYEHTGTEFEFDSKAYPEVAHSVACYHALTTYLWLLNQQSGLGLGSCARPAQTTAAKVSSTAG